MLNSNLMNQLLMIQSTVHPADIPGYHVHTTTLTCAGGPTSCQNQW